MGHVIEFTTPIKLAPSERNSRIEWLRDFQARRSTSWNFQSGYATFHNGHDV
jgi:hypothetical protein